MNYFALVHLCMCTKMFKISNFFNQILILKEYSEDSNSEPDVDLENQYYNSKALKEDEPSAALGSFAKVWIIWLYTV